jgi:hypothetical protein
VSSIAALVVKFEAGIFAIAALGAAIQFYKADWSSSIFIFVWIALLLNIPLAWYAGRSLYLSRRKKSSP